MRPVDPDRIRLNPILDYGNREIPEVQLAIAVIARAILDAVSPRSTVEAAIVRGAEAWIMSDADDEYSFLWITERLFEHGEEVRGRIREMVRSKDRRGIKAMLGRVKN